jgi:hypothetical protein
MSDAVAPRSRGPSSRRLLTRSLAVAVLVAPILLFMLVVDTGSRVADAGPPDAIAARRTGDVAARLQALVATQAADGQITFSQDEVRAVLAAAQRMRPGVLGQAQVAADGVRLTMSAGAPILPAGLWLNLHTRVAPSEDGLRIVSTRVGRLPVPPALAAYALRYGLTRLLGDPLGAQAFESVAAVRLDPPTAGFARRHPRRGRGSRPPAHLRRGNAGAHSPSFAAGGDG